jgi:curli biogenesis system outer membrane secretion channel CsgG
MTCKGPPIRVAVSAFDYTETQSGDIGEGMANMLTDALTYGDCFVIVRGEQRSQPPDAPPPAPLSDGGHAGAAASPATDPQLLIEGSIGTFQAPCKGGSLFILAGNQACVAFDLRVIDAASGQTVHSAAVIGDSKVGGAGLIYARGILPPALGAYSGTPMEQAIRNSIESAANSMAYWYLTEQP